MTSNRLLQALPSEEYQLLDQHMTSVNMPLRRVLIEVDQPIEAVYFPENGIISVVSRLEEQTVEVATIGNEGFVGTPLVLGADRCATQAFSQVPGYGRLISAVDFLEAFKSLPGLRSLLQRNVHCLIEQIGQSAACNRTHSIVQRCARWLLMTHDRVLGDCFVLTQEFLGEMLGVRRPQVNRAALSLSQAGLIRYTRGNIEVVDRPGLEKVACSCYEVVKRAYDRAAADAL